MNITIWGNFTFTEILFYSAFRARIFYLIANNKQELQKNYKQLMNYLHSALPLILTFNLYFLLVFSLNTFFELILLN